jgi:3-deoxy-D-manno-octulosonic-acid transferase
MGGSTWPGEERALALMLPRLRVVEPRLRLLLAPRHAERAPAVVGDLRSAGLTVGFRKVPDGQSSAPDADVFLLNTTGELMAFYAAAHLVFVGKTLFEKGGQNFIEPALFSKPILVGPHTENFPQVARDFLEAGAMVQVKDAGELESRIAGFLQDSSSAEAMGRRAGELVARSRGALERTLDRLIPVALPVKF